MTDRAIARALDAVEVREARKVLILLRQIRREFEQPRCRLNSVWFDPRWPVSSTGRDPSSIASSSPTSAEHRLAGSTPAFVPGGTGSLQLNRRVFGAHMLERHFPVPRNAEVMTFTDPPYNVEGQPERRDPDRLVWSLDVRA